MDETLFKFVPEPENVLEQLLNNSNDGKLFDGNLDDLLKLPVNKLYASNQERIKRNLRTRSLVAEQPGPSLDLVSSLDENESLTLAQFTQKEPIKNTN